MLVGESRQTTFVKSYKVIHPKICIRTEAAMTQHTHVNQATAHSKPSAI